jgi:hypothetical protein
MTAQSHVGCPYDIMSLKPYVKLILLNFELATAHLSDILVIKHVTFQSVISCMPPYSATSPSFNPPETI